MNARDAGYRLVDLGDRRVLTVDGHAHATSYSLRVVRMLIERKGPRRAALYFPFKETRGRHFLSPVFRYLRALPVDGLSVLEVGCSFGHITECLAEAPEVAELCTFDTDPAFVAITRAKVEEMGLKAVQDVLAFTDEETCRLPYAGGRFDFVAGHRAIGVECDSRWLPVLGWWHAPSAVRGDVGHQLLGRAPQPGSDHSSAAATDS